MQKYHFLNIFNVQCKQCPQVTAPPSKIIQIILLILKNMRKGHKRTQSATITGNHSQGFQDYSLQNDLQLPHQQIPDLLTESSAKIKEKVCHVESLDIAQVDHSDPLFAFGKGTMVKTLERFKKTAQLAENLISIPQKEQYFAKQKNIAVRGNDCLEQTFGQEKSKENRIPFEEKTNRTLRALYSPRIKREEMKKGFGFLQNYQSKMNYIPHGQMKFLSNIK